MRPSPMQSRKCSHSLRRGWLASTPGMLTSHYAPRAGVRLNASSPQPGEAFLAFGPTSATLNTASDATFLNLSERGDLREAAANLFAHLRALDASDVSLIAVAPVPYEGLGEAINDSLRRGFGDGVWVRGEITGWSDRGNHAYFTLADDDADTKAVINVQFFANARMRLRPMLRKNRLRLADGM